MSLQNFYLMNPALRQKRIYCKSAFLYGII